MSLYDKSKEEIYEFLEKNYILSEETKKKLKDEYIDGEVLFELNDEDFLFFQFKPFVISTIKFKIKKEKELLKGINESRKKDLIKKLKKFGIDNPDKFLNSDYNKMGLRVGQKKLLNKLMKISKINLIDIDILKYLKDEIGLSESTITNLDGITKEYLFKMEKNEINDLNIKDEDKKKLINLIKEKNIKKLNENNQDIKIEQNLNDIEKKMSLDDMIIFEFALK